MRRIEILICYIKITGQGGFFFFKLISGYSRFIRDLRAQSESEIETKEIVLALFAFISMSPELS